MLTGEGRGVVTSQRMELDLNAKGSLRDGHLAGGVTYRNETPGRQEHGSAADARCPSTRRASRYMQRSSAA